MPHPRPAAPSVRSGSVPPAASRRRRRPLAGFLAGLLTAASALAVGVVADGAAPADAAANRSPFGVAERLWFRPGGMYFSGWAIDPSAPKKAINAYVMVDGKYAGRSPANLPRPDVAKLHPSAGANHGFRFALTIPEGTHRVCVKAQNVGAGKNAFLRCQNRTLDYGPVGAVQHATARGGHVRISGWTVDWDNRTTALSVTATLDGTATTAVADRPDSAATVPYGGTAGANHGYSFALPATQGRHTICLTATNVGFGTDTSFGCRKLTLNDSPRAHLDYLRQAKNELRVVGWAFDPNAAKTPATVVVAIDGTAHVVTADRTRTDVAAHYPNTGSAHGYDVSYALPEGRHRVCVTARNVGFGSDAVLPCSSLRLNFTPSAAATGVEATPTGARVGGWAVDPDTSSPISVRISLDDTLVTTVVAARKKSRHPGHGFLSRVTTRSGRHVLCAVAVNTLYGTHDSAPSCRTITLALNPLGKFESLDRASGGVRATGWAFDPDTRSPLSVLVTVDGHPAPAITASAVRRDVSKSYPQAGAAHGISSVIATDDGEHTVCLTAHNVSGGADVSLGCHLVIAVNPVAPTAPGNVTAQAGYGGAVVSWTPPTSDGGAPWTQYVITAAPGGTTATVAAAATSATITGLKPSTTYSFTVQAVNVAGSSPTATSPSVKTQASPPAQNTPAPVSTSRYIRNVRGASPAELATMRTEGGTDAFYNPSGHGYLILLDIGGQDQVDGGVVLSATTRFVSYGDLVKDVEAYVDGYAGKQKASAPVTIAIGTNNDMDVSSTSGRAWADRVVDPIAAYTKTRYPGIVIAGANDVEPGFRAGYSQTKAWLTGYLAATTAPFVFNGSADGCAWTVINRSCNNGWTMAGLYYLAAGAAPIRMLNLPQIYNYTMADQWKYISLTGVAKGQPRIDFAGTLTEWTACDQTNGCGSISGHSAWSRMWSNLQSDARLKVSSLPYSTDLRIDR